MSKPRLQPTLDIAADTFPLSFEASRGKLNHWDGSACAQHQILRTATATSDETNEHALPTTHAFPPSSTRAAAAAADETGWLQLRDNGI